MTNLYLFYLIGGGLALFGLGVLSIGGLIEGLILLLVSAPFLGIAFFTDVRERRERRASLLWEAHYAKERELEKQRALLQDQAATEKWWKDHHRGLQASPPQANPTFESQKTEFSEQTALDIEQNRAT